VKRFLADCINDDECKFAVFPDADFVRTVEGMRTYAGDAYELYPKHAVEALTELGFTRQEIMNNFVATKSGTHSVLDRGPLQIFNKETGEVDRGILDYWSTDKVVEDRIAEDRITQWFRITNGTGDESLEITGEAGSEAAYKEAREKAALDTGRMHEIFEDLMMDPTMDTMAYNSYWHFLRNDRYNPEQGALDMGVGGRFKGIAGDFPEQKDLDAFTTNSRETYVTTLEEAGFKTQDEMVAELPMGVGLSDLQLIRGWNENSAIDVKRLHDDGIDAFGELFLEKSTARQTGELTYLSQYGSEDVISFSDVGLKSFDGLIIRDDDSLAARSLKEMFSEFDRIVNDEHFAEFRSKFKIVEDKVVRGSESRLTAFRITDDLRERAATTAIGQGGMFRLFQGDEAKPRGEATIFPSSGQAFVRGINKPDVSTAVHEGGHVLMNQLKANGNRDVVETMERAFGVTDGNWDRDSLERFAEAFEAWVAEGTAQDNPAFARLAASMRDHYNAHVLGGPNADALTPEIREFFESLGLKDDLPIQYAPGQYMPAIQWGSVVAKAQRVQEEGGDWVNELEPGDWMAVARINQKSGGTVRPGFLSLNNHDDILKYVAAFNDLSRQLQREGVIPEAMSDADVQSLALRQYNAILGRADVELGSTIAELMVRDARDPGMAARNAYSMLMLHQSFLVHIDQLAEQAYTSGKVQDKALLQRAFIEYQHLNVASLQLARSWGLEGRAFGGTLPPPNSSVVPPTLRPFDNPGEPVNPEAVPVPETARPEAQPAPEGQTVPEGQAAPEGQPAAATAEPSAEPTKAPKKPRERKPRGRMPNDIVRAQEIIADAEMAKLFMEELGIKGPVGDQLIALIRNAPKDPTERARYIREIALGAAMGRSGEHMMQSIIHEVFINGLLGSMKTFIGITFASPPLMAAMTGTSKLLGAMFHGDTLVAQDTARNLFRNFANSGYALWYAVKALGTEQNTMIPRVQLDDSNMDRNAISAPRASARALPGEEVPLWKRVYDPAHVVNAIGRLVRGPSTAIMSIDEGFKQMFARTYAMSKSYRDIMDETVSRARLDGELGERTTAYELELFYARHHNAVTEQARAEVDTIIKNGRLQDLDAVITEAKQQPFMQELAGDPKAQYEAMKDYVDQNYTSRHEQLISDTRQNATRLLFQNPLEGNFGKGIKWLVDEGLAGMGRFIVPFLRTPVQLFVAWGGTMPTATGIEGIARLRNYVREGTWDLPSRKSLEGPGSPKDDWLTQIHRGHLRDLQSPDRAVRYEAQGRQVLALGMMTWAYSMYSDGKITGGGPTEPNARKIWLQNHQPYSILVNGEWWSYAKGDPASMTIGTFVDFCDIYASEPTMPDEAGHGILGALGLSFIRMVQNRSYLQTVGSIMNVVETQGRTADKAVRDFALSFIPYSSFLNQMAKHDDPLIREQRTWLEAFQNRTPGWISGEAPPKFMFDGRPARSFVDELEPYQDWLLYVAPTRIRKASTDPVYMEFERVGYSKGSPDVVRSHIDMNSLPGPEGYQWSAYTYYCELIGTITDSDGRTLNDQLMRYIGENGDKREKYLNLGTKRRQLSQLDLVVEKYQDIAYKQMLRDCPWVHAAKHERELMMRKAERPEIVEQFGEGSPEVKKHDKRNHELTGAISQLREGERSREPIPSIYQTGQ